MHHVFYIVFLVPIAIWILCSLIALLPLLFLYFNFGFNEGDKVYGYGFIAWTPSSSRNAFGKFLQKHMLKLSIGIGLVLAILVFKFHPLFE